MFYRIRHINNNRNKHAYAGQLNSFIHQRALLVLHDRGNVVPNVVASQLASLMG
jgi:hypothetical protein